ncbi:hypothetical protein MtrunA17_Chr3g0140991 [Medicago truncatula]|uniref:Uncharacterized protein n=1 Tax=Medicago truncatula TaxID=3880 RepID=I3SSL7_MEDTR|nr:unknown [Medicago truncatula]KEH36116.1 hypothetical protein MTR_3g111095 [Medicago truncatula]RHN70948.1 hypothetical protein MtrunA17_Chr3g0140991 [Medicago truncatula]
MKNSVAPATTSTPNNRRNRSVRPCLRNPNQQLKNTNLHTTTNKNGDEPRGYGAIDHWRRSTQQTTHLRRRGLKKESLDSTGRKGGVVEKRRKHHLRPDLHLG